MGFDTVNPKDNSTIKSYSFDSQSEVQETLSRADTSFSLWSNFSIEKRVELIKHFNELLLENRAVAAQKISQEMGKPLEEALAEVSKCSSMISYYCDNAVEFLKERPIQSSFPNSAINYCPQGIIFGVMPWNFPFWQVLRFAIPTLLVGNTVLIKHAPNVQGCQDFIEQLAAKAFKEDNPIHGLIIDIDQIESVVGDPRIRGVSFTGSEQAGKSIAQLAAKYLKKSVLELGGSDAYIILADANLENAAKACVTSRFLNCGQSCVAAKRWIVEQSVHDQFLELVKKEVSQLVVGDPLSSNTSLGPMARLDLKQKLIDQVEKSLCQGAVMSFGDEDKLNDETCFIEPMILTNIKEDHPVFSEETFGPVACIIKANDLEDAIRLANDTNYGLGGALFTSDTIRAKEIALKRLDTGGVFINDFYKSGAELPFGGVKSSGIGRELSYLALYEFANIKTLSIKD